ncbi:MAG: Uma2 family endonuclease [Thiohalocapsa sp.]|jgi:Uma2 family endonuclease|uniref:Uma2 family endonuclease n=1 Tax=Thiohalocapsa sp. TaxID=2497641 RepID=UPI0025EAE03C|nr:Uma2 family endonuclease [Thiohalocapsa sp.]MCG6940862.1 Uma2 family endonuclease [Thiohalocapsa sp.]
MTQPALKIGQFTYGDYRRWPEEERWELIDGEAWDMSPAPTRAHQQMVVELTRQIGNFLLGKPCEVYAAPFDVRLPRADEADDRVESVVQPDVAVICDSSKLDDAGCRGAPDWIIEVLSRRTAVKDHTVKRDLYERHGVQEYWLVHPTDRVLTIYRLVDGAYGKPDVQALTGETPVRVIDGLGIQWGEDPDADVTLETGEAAGG